MFKSPRTALAAFALAALAGAQSANAQALAYGVTANGTLFNFFTNNVAVANTIGNLGFTPEAIDFRPGTQTLYALDIGSATTQLYTINVVTAVATPVGPGFASSVSGSYTLAGPVGFDFNPRTLQGDGSVRIRLVATNGANLRLHSATGLVAGVDAPLNSSGTPFVDAAAYINSANSTVGTAGPTTLYTLDSNTDSLYTQIPPNNGTQNLVGAFGVTVDADPGISFDILSTNPLDDSIADELAFATFTRSGVSGGSYLLYDVNLATGQTTNGRLVGGGLDFTGGFAVTVVPEPTAAALLAPLAALTLRRRR